MLKKVGTELKPALAFLRRGYGVAQRSAIGAFAAASGFEIVSELSTVLDSAAETSTPALTLANITALLVRIDLDHVRAVIVSTATLFSEQSIDRIIGYERLRERGVELIAADAPDAFAQESDAHRDVLQILAATSQFDAAAASAAMRSASVARRTRTGKPHRKTYAELHPEATLMAKRLYQSSKASGERITLRGISAQLAESGYVDQHKSAFHPEVIRRMLNGNWPRNRRPE
jgi:DNA invertase Pin-like site-specific DNA recombinase